MFSIGAYNTYLSERGNKNRHDVIGGNPVNNLITYS